MMSRGRPREPAAGPAEVTGPSDPVPIPSTRSTGARGLRLLAVHAHPDDESSKGAATMARYLAEGVR